MKKMISMLLLICASSMAFATTEDDGNIEAKRDSFDVKEERSKVKYRFVPTPSYDPSTKLGLSAINMFAYYPQKWDTISPASVGGFGPMYTTNNSWMVGAWNNMYLNEDNWRLTALTIYGRLNQELDLGNNKPADAQREMVVANLEVLRRVYKRFYAGIGYSYRYVNFTGNDEESQKQIDDAGNGGGEGNHGIKYFLQQDTRDNINYPYKGYLALFRAEQYFNSSDDSDNGYTALNAEYRQFINLGEKKGEHVLATRLMAKFLAGNPESQNYAYYGRTGAEVQRGYQSGKYIDKNMMNLEAEYRWESPLLNNKIGFAALVGAGKVFGEYNDFSEAELLPMGGVGIRYRMLPYERMNIRFDYTYGKDGGVWYFGIMESF